MPQSLSVEFVPNNEEDISGSEEPLGSVDVDKLEKMRGLARNRVNQIRNLDEAKDILFSLCNEGEEWLLAKLAK